MRTILLLGTLCAAGCTVADLEPPKIEKPCCEQTSVSARFSDVQGAQAIVGLEYASDLTIAALRVSDEDIWRFVQSVSASAGMKHECNLGIGLVLDPTNRVGRLEVGAESIPFTIEPPTQASLGNLSGNWEYSEAATTTQVRIIDLESVLFLFDLRQPCAIMAGHTNGLNFELAAQPVLDHAQLEWSGEFSADFTSASGVVTSYQSTEGTTTSTFVIRRVTQ